MNKGVISTLDNYFNKTKKLKMCWHNADFKIFLNNIDFKNTDFLAPPYLISASEYNKIWNIKQETELLSILDSLNIKWAISNVTHYKGKSKALFLEWSKKYNTHYINSNYIRYHDTSNKKPVEVLVTNY